MRIDRSSRFKRSYQKLPSPIKNSFDERIGLFFKNPFDPVLRTHKLHGNLDSYYAFCLRDGYRVLFEFADRDSILLVNIGGHDDYAKWAR
ncbi:MAG: type II toxin-antitoxin system mRNA interferase toxin, RelE/StbE family [Candidatus Magasanikbacteria bacterium]|nr:type II toxin-antitoxin system mRNA interferase toxin, RelE/StbE family [Candidatus Magasanikbacteria bacterium]